MPSYKYINILFALLFCFGCSTQKDAAINRFIPPIKHKIQWTVLCEKRYLKRGVNKLNRVTPGQLFRNNYCFFAR